MKRMLTILFFLCIASVVMAADLTPVVRIHTNSGAEVYVACFRVDQFSDHEVLAEKYLLIACRKSTWDDLGNQKQAKIKAAIRKLLAGEVRLTKAKMQAWRDALADANIIFRLVDDPDTFLRGKGCVPKPSIGP